MWFMSLSFNDTRNLRNAMLSKSEDGEGNLTEPVTLIDDANPHVFNDKNTLTADPDSDLVYAVWDRLVFPNERTQGDSCVARRGLQGPDLSKTRTGRLTTAATGSRGRSSTSAATTRRSATRSPSCRARRRDGEHVDQRIRLDPQRQQARAQGREDLGHVVATRRYVVGSGRHRLAGGPVRHRPRRRALSRAARQQERPLHLPAAHR